MKLIPMLAVASLLTSGAAFAADAPAAAAAPAAKASHPSLKHCRKEASEKGLKGKEAKAYVKECRAGTK